MSRLLQRTAIIAAFNLLALASAGALAEDMNEAGDADATWRDGASMASDRKSGSPQDDDAP